jgi:hypothetical protein
MGSHRATENNRPQQNSSSTTDEDSSTMTPSSNQDDGPTPVAVANDRQWFEGTTDAPVNGPFHGGEFWEVIDQYNGTKYTPGCDKSIKSLKAFDFFMAMFPRRQLEQMVVNTSEALNKKGRPSTSTGEMLKFFGVMILATRYEFGCRRSLWSTTPLTKYVPAPSFGNLTGMSKNRFDDIWSCVVWSFQQKDRPEDMTHEAHRWMLVEDFVDNFNEHRKKYVKPSDTLCVDESISRWYGLGGHWINMGLPMYISLDRKPEDGAEIQNVCDGHSNIMLRLKLVKSAQEAAIISASR